MEASRITPTETVLIVSQFTWGEGHDAPKRRDWPVTRRIRTLTLDIHCYPNRVTCPAGVSRITRPNRSEPGIARAVGAIHASAARD